MSIIIEFRKFTLHFNDQKISFRIIKFDDARKNRIKNGVKNE